MFGMDDLLPCAQCNSLVEMQTLDGEGICPECIIENEAVAEVLEDAPDWLNKSPAWWNDSTSFSS